MNLSLGLSASRALVRHPVLWPTAARQLWRLRRRDWWREAPYLPVPPSEYVRFRLVTAYGDPLAKPADDDVVGYLSWCRAWPRVAG